jgi:hypothetical protein
VPLLASSCVFCCCSCIGVSPFVSGWVCVCQSVCLRRCRSVSISLCPARLVSLSLRCALLAFPCCSVLLRRLAARDISAFRNPDPPPPELVPAATPAVSLCFERTPTGRLRGHRRRLADCVAAFSVHVPSPLRFGPVSCDGDLVPYSILPVPLLPAVLEMLPPTVPRPQLPPGAACR